MPTSNPITTRQTWDRHIEWHAPGDARLSAYLYDPALPKACVHPLLTPRGHCLTGFEPSDHVWHRGVWFTIKLLNKTNFWEEQAPFGVQRTIGQPSVELLAGDTLRIGHDLSWTSGATGPALQERRILTHRQHDDGTRSLDWHCQLTAEQDLELDRTPYTTWGGYGGFSYRAAREVHAVSFLTPQGSAESIAGNPHDWVLMQGMVDGGVEQKVALGMIDHPANPRGQTPWYCKSSNGFTFMNAAFLFHEPMSVGKGETLRFSYRLLYRDGTWSAEAFAALADEFRKAEVAS